MAETLERMWVAMRIDHQEKPKDCVGLLGVGNKQECERLVLDSMRADLQFGAEQGIVAKAIEDALGHELYMETNLEEILANVSDSVIEAASEELFPDISYHVLLPGGERSDNMAKKRAQLEIFMVDHTEKFDAACLELFGARRSADNMLDPHEVIQLWDHVFGGKK